MKEQVNVCSNLRSMFFVFDFPSGLRFIRQKKGKIHQKNCLKMAKESFGSNENFSFT